MEQSKEKDVLMRADELLVKINACQSRSQARHLILSKNVSYKGKTLLKPGKMLPLKSHLQIKTNSKKYVSRGGEKLEAFLAHFKINVANKITLDIGASTGGFTDCLLQRGATYCVCLDVGHSQLHPSLLNNPRVLNLEKINARYLNKAHLPHASYDCIVMDVSFISIKKLLTSIWPFLEINGEFILLLKPQFETSKKIMDKCNGVIKDESTHTEILEHTVAYIKKTLKDSEIIGVMPSPILGAKGNKEFLIGLRKIALYKH